MNSNFDKAALLVIDLQKDFCPGGALAVPQGDQIIPRINGIAGLFRHIVLTQDWHPEGHLSFASAWPGRALYESVEAGGRPQTLWPDHCVQGSPGADFHPALDSSRASLILRKGRSPGLDSYSAFFENDRSSSTGLEGWLRALGIGRIYLCGLATDYCVFYSAMDARRLGLEVHLLGDASAGVDLPAGNVKRRIADMKTAGVVISATTELE